MSSADGPLSCLQSFLLQTMLPFIITSMQPFTCVQIDLSDTFPCVGISFSKQKRYKSKRKIITKRKEGNKRNNEKKEDRQMRKIKRRKE